MSTAKRTRTNVYTLAILAYNTLMVTISNAIAIWALMYFYSVRFYGLLVILCMVVVSCVFLALTVEVVHKKPVKVLPSKSICLYTTVVFDLMSVTVLYILLQVSTAPLIQSAYMSDMFTQSAPFGIGRFVTADYYMSIGSSYYYELTIQELMRDIPWYIMSFLLVVIGAFISVLNTVFREERRKK